MKLDFDKLEKLMLLSISELATPPKNASSCSLKLSILPDTGNRLPRTSTKTDGDLELSEFYHGYFMLWY